MLDDPEPALRRIAVWAPAAIPDHQVIAALTPISEDPDEEGRLTAAAMLRRLVRRTRTGFRGGCRRSALMAQNELAASATRSAVGQSPARTS